VASGNYWVGDFDGTTFTAEKGITPTGRLDYGSNYYAAQTFSNAPHGRRLLLAWMTDGFARNGIWNQMSWQSGYSVVRELSLKLIDGNPEVVVQPAPELNQLRGQRFSLRTKALSAGASLPLGASGRELDIEVTLDPGSATKSGLRVLVGAGEETVIGYESATHEVYIDRSRSDGMVAGRAPGGFGGRPSLRAKLPQSAWGHPVRLRVLVDRSAIEVFANGGTRAMALHVFPIQSNTLTEQGAAGDNNLKLSSTGGVTSGGKLKLNFGPDGPLGKTEPVTVTSVGTADVSTSLSSAAHAGDVTIRADNVANVTPGRRVSISVGSGVERVEVATTGTAASNPTVLFAAAAAGEKNIKLANVAGITEGALLSIDTGAEMEMKTVALGGVGTGGRTLLLAAPASTGETKIKVANVAGLQIGVPLAIGDGEKSSELRTITGPVDGSGRFNGTGGAAGSGIILSAPLMTALNDGSAVRYLGSGVALTEPLSQSHAERAPARSMGTGITLTAPLQLAHCAGATVVDSGTGVEIMRPLQNAWPTGTVVSNEPGGGIELFAIGGSARVSDLNVWQMKSAW